MASSELLKAIAVTSELCGRTFSQAAGEVFVADLAQYPEPAVMTALKRCRQEVRGILTVQDVVSRLDDGRPGVEEAWGMLPRDESQSVVWTEEMAAAFGAALPLLEDGDRIAARMAFKESYGRRLIDARSAGKPPVWTLSAGHDARGRKDALEQAIALGRLESSAAQHYLPAPETEAGNSLAHGLVDSQRNGREPIKLVRRA